MTFNQQLNEALLAVREVRLDKKSDDELHVLIGVLRRWQASENAPQAKPAIEAIQDELARRHATAMNRELIAQQQRLHQEMVAETKALQSSVQKLHKPHWTVNPGFLVISLTMIFAAIAAWPVVREWIPAFRPAVKAAGFQPQQSNSVPAQPQAQQTSPVAPAAIQGTNQPKR